MKLLSTLRNARTRQLAKYKHLQLKDMPLWYLVTLAALMSLDTWILSPRLAEAKGIYFDQLLPTAPWQISAVVGIWLLTCGALLGAAALLAHGKALAERLFDSPPPRPHHQ